MATALQNSVESTNVNQSKGGLDSLKNHFLKDWTEKNSEEGLKSHTSYPSPHKQNYKEFMRCCDKIGLWQHIKIFILLR